METIGKSDEHHMCDHQKSSLFIHSTKIVTSLKIHSHT